MQGKKATSANFLHEQRTANEGGILNRHITILLINEGVFTFSLVMTHIHILFDKLARWTSHN